MPDIFSHRDLQALYESASMVLRNGALPETLRPSLERLERMCHIRESSEGRLALQKARDLHAGNSSNVEIDEQTMVYSNQDDGWWVMAWCFVPSDEMEAILVSSSNG